MQPFCLDFFLINFGFLPEIFGFLLKFFSWICKLKPGALVAANVEAAEEFIPTVTGAGSCLDFVSIFLDFLPKTFRVLPLDMHMD